MINIVSDEYRLRNLFFTKFSQQMIKATLLTRKQKIYKLHRNKAMGGAVILKLRSDDSAGEQRTPAVLTIAGSDSSGGAGIEADLKAITANGAYGLTCITALTAQNTQKVYAVQKTPERFIRDILEANFKDFVEDDDPPLKVVKTGMLTQDAINVLSEYLPYLKLNNIPLVVDPVMISTSGTQLLEEKAMKMCIDNVIGRSYLLSPNFDEAKMIWQIVTKENPDNIPLNSLEDLQNFIVSLQEKLGCENLLVKGGHLIWDKTRNKPVKKFQNHDPQNLKVLDILYESKAGTVTIFESNFIDSSDTHGSGCTLASSIAANLAHGRGLKNSILLSIDYIHMALSSQKRKLGHGNGPLNHLVKVETSVSKVLDPSTNNINPYVEEKFSSFLDFFKTHPKIKDNWERYTTHPFVELLAQNKLPFKSFLYFLKQDYHYLINYSQCIGIGSSFAPTSKHVYLDAHINGSIAQELDRHKEKLSSEYNIDYDRDLEVDADLSPGKACLEYCSYLLDVANNQDYLAVKTALAPCLHGYYDAGKFGLNIRQHLDTNSLGVLNNQKESDVYSSWLNDYGSEWYRSSNDSGSETLQELLRITPINQERLEELVDIFNKVTLLEISFWDEALNIDN